MRPGRARWYKFDVQPGSNAHVSLSNLPADYDVFLFKDIKQAYTDLSGGNANLTKAVGRVRRQRLRRR